MRFTKGLRNGAAVRSRITCSEGIDQLADVMNDGIRAACAAG